MSIYKRRRTNTNYRKLYEKHNGPIPRDEFGRKYEIHHIDGNSNNNSLSNLMCVSIQQHYLVHLYQNDLISSYLIAKRMEEIPTDQTKNLQRKAASMNALKQVENGTHIFLGGEIQRKVQQKLVSEGKHHCQTQEWSEYISKRNKEQISLGIHPWQDKERASKHARKQVENGTNPWLSGDLPRQIHKRKFADGSHHLLKSDTCSHCGKVGQRAIMKRWHFDNCKSKV